MLLSMCRADYSDWHTPVCDAEQPEISILQVSDTHIRNAADAAWVYTKLQAAIAAHAPKRIVFTGDITANGKPEEWFALQQALQQISNLVFIWGNHDMPLKLLLPENPGKTSWEDIGNFRLIYLDTAWPGPFVGSYTSLPSVELEKLKQAAATEKKILLFGHHPISADAPHFVLANAEEIRGIFGAARLMGVFTGHFHGAYVKEDRGVVYAGVAPFSSHQMNHTFSQSKGYRKIEVGKDCLRTTHPFVE